MVRVNVFGDFKCDNIIDLYMGGGGIQELLNSGDVNVLNFEAIVKADKAKPIKKTGPHLENSQIAPSILKQHGFTLFNLANNHALDYGPDSLIKTINLFTDENIIGAGTWDAAYKIKIIEKDSIRIGFIAVTHHEFGVLYERFYQKEKIGTAWMLHPYVDEMIVNSKNFCDYLIMLPHCGVEYEYYPLPEIRTLFRHWIDLGADGIIASHPHTPQPWENYKGKPIFYSLGNFCFSAIGSNVPPYWYWSLIVSLSFANDGMQFAVNYCKYDYINNNVSIIYDDSNFNNHILEINRILSDEALYLTKINDLCIRLRPMFVNFAGASGFYSVDLFSLKILIKNALKRILGRKRDFPQGYLINSIRCETHRWTLQRILELESNTTIGN